MSSGGSTFYGELLNAFWILLLFAWMFYLGWIVSRHIAFGSSDFRKFRRKAKGVFTKEELKVVERCYDTVVFRDRLLKSCVTMSKIGNQLKGTEFWDIYEDTKVCFFKNISCILAYDILNEGSKYTKESKKLLKRNETYLDKLSDIIVCSINVEVAGSNKHQTESLDDLVRSMHELLESTSVESDDDKEV